jgi:hypothetical protein
MRQMLADVEAYNRANGVILPEPGYDPVKQLLRNNWPVLLKQLWLLPTAILGVLGLLVGWAWRRGLRERQRSDRASCGEASMLA